MTIAQELRQARDWLAQHERDPFFWLIILGPLTLAAITLGGVVVFPPSDAIRTIRQVLPSADITVQPKNLCKTSRGIYIFGYDFAVKTDHDHSEKVGRICRDVLKGGWVLTIDNPKFKYLEPS